MKQRIYNSIPWIWLLWKLLKTTIPVRVKLFFWFLMLAVISVFAPKYPASVCKAYSKSIGGE